SSLGATQGGLIDRVNELSKDDKLKEYDVVVWMNGQVTESMDASKGLLAKANLGSPTTSAQQGAVDKLQMIIDALEEEKRHTSEFQQVSGGGGGGKPPLIPALAQLKMLKAMQVVVNGETRSVDDRLKSAQNDADKNDLRGKADKLANKQGEIRGIAD